MLSREATNTNFIVFGFTRSGLEPMIHHTRGDHANHYTTDAVNNEHNSYPKMRVKMPLACSQVVLYFCRFIFLSRSESVQVFLGFLLFVYICISIGYPVIKRRRVGIPLNGLTQPHFFACPKPGPWFQMPYFVVFILFNDCLLCWIWWHCWPSQYIFSFIFIIVPKKITLKHKLYE